jgi:hypothetical protein
MIRPLCLALALSCLSAPAFAETCVASHYGYGGGRDRIGREDESRRDDRGASRQTLRLSRHCHITFNRPQASNRPG